MLARGFVFFFIVLLSGCASNPKTGNGNVSTFPAQSAPVPRPAPEPVITALEWPSKTNPTLRISVSPRAGEAGVQRVDVLVTLNGKTLIQCVNAPVCTIDLVKDFALEGATERVLQMSMAVRINGVEKKNSSDRLDLGVFLHQAYRLQLEVPKYRAPRHGTRAGVYKVGELVTLRDSNRSFRQTCGANDRQAWAREDVLSRSAKTVWVSQERIRQWGCS